MFKKGDKDKLFAGPFIGEFGHELFSWQAYVREYAKTFDTVVVASRKEYEFLYEDFCTEFIPVDVGTFNAATFEVLECIEENIKYRKKIHSKYNINKKHTIMSTNIERENITRQTLNSMKADYILFGKKDETINYDVVLHPRNFSGFNGKCSDLKKSRDWDIKKWNKLVKKLTSQGLKVATIGLSSSAFYVEGSEDLRDISLKDLSNVLSNSKCIMGPSSGPMHFATLCGCPQVVWSHPCNKNRYIKEWNPFNIDVVFYDKDNWNPSVDTTYKLYEQLIEIIQKKETTNE